MTSQPCQAFIDTFLVDPRTSTYSLSNFTIVNDGVMHDGATSAETFIGSARSDIVWGNGGADLLRGGDARDLITGCAGNDTLYGGRGMDRLQGWGDDDFLYGGSERDALFGGEGEDQLFGGAGNDYLCAGSDSDELTGGGGADIFVFRPALDANRSTSVYLDFDLTQDRLRIEDYLLPDGLSRSVIKVEGDGDLCITTSGGHRMSFETLDRGDIDALYAALSLI